jgi:predicted lipid carrier protein YhbT
LLRLDPERMATLSNRLMGVVGAALAYRRADQPGRSVRFVLTGPAGGSYTVALTPDQEPGAPDATIVADAFDICRVAARRLDPDDLPAVIEGDRELADLVLAGLDSFARD